MYFHPHRRFHALIVTFALFAGLGQLAGASGSWETIGPWGGEMYCLAQAPLEPNVLFAGCDALFKSGDGGASWYRLPVPKQGFVSCVTAAGAGQDLLATAFSFGVNYPLVSSDGGQSWQQATDDVFADNKVHWLSFTSHTADGGSLVACTSEGLFASDDSLTDWQRIGEGIPTTTTTAFFTCSAPGEARYYFACGQNQGLYRSEDLASGWQELDLPQPELRIKRVAVEWRNRMNVYACGEAGVFRSTDGGSTWDTIWQEETDRVALASSATTVIYAAGGFGLVVSPDSGASWQTRQDGLVIGNWVTGDLVVSSQSPLDAWLASFAGVYRTEDAGGSWYPSNQGISSWSVSNVAVSDRAPGLIFANCVGDLFRKTQEADWQLLGVTGTTIDLSVSWIALDPTDDATVYASTYQGLIRSRDTGNAGTWESVLELVPGPYGLAIDAENGDNLYLATLSRGVMVSRDGGESWQESNSGLALDGKGVWLISIAPSDPNVLWAALGDVWAVKDIYKTTDAGQSWATVATITYGVNCITIDPSDADVVYLGVNYGGNRVEKTSDGGKTFVPLSEGLPDMSVSDVAIDPTDTRIVYAATEMRGSSYPGAGLYALDPIAGLEWEWIECPGIDARGLYKVAVDPWEQGRVLCAFMGGSLYAYQKAAGPAIELSLSTEQNQYVAGETHVARISATNSGGDINVDLYIAIMLPDGALFFWPGFSSEMGPGYWMTPMPEGFSISDYVFFDMALPDSLPGGNYTWFGMFYGQGTEDAVSNLASANWTFLPQRSLCDFCVLEETESDVGGHCEVQFGVSHLVQSDLSCGHHAKDVRIAVNSRTYQPMTQGLTEEGDPCNKLTFSSGMYYLRSGVEASWSVLCDGHGECDLSGSITPYCD